MKSVLLFLFTLSLCSPWLASPHALAADTGGGSVDNGGELLALKFTRIGQETLSALKKLSPDEAILDLADLQRFEIALVATRVDAVKGPLLDNAGLQVDARYLISSGKGLIEIDSGRWNTFLTDETAVYRLVFHEYLRAMGVNDDNYRVSVRLEEGTVNEILRGRVVVNPGGVGAQSVFDQLGDYFRQADVLTTRTLGLKDKWSAFCAGEFEGSMKLRTEKVDSGPLLDPTYRLSFLSDNELSWRFFSSSIYSNTLDKKDGSLVFTGEKKFLFREKNRKIFMEQINPFDNAPLTRCYFW